MPAELPATSGYTYCAELSIDEALSAGATDVQFSVPLPFYVENFLGFPVPQGAGPTFDSFLAKGPSEFKQAAEFYRYVGGPLGEGRLEAWALTAKDPAMRRRALLALGRLQDPETADTLDFLD